MEAHSFTLLPQEERTLPSHIPWKKFEAETCSGVWLELCQASYAIAVVEERNINISHNMQFTRAYWVQLWTEWEIQLMVLLSFVLQFFLFFTGGLRRRKTNILLRVFIWLAYVGADLVAMYTLGLLSRYEDNNNCGRDSFRGTDPLAFIWVPFLLVHLGGQDTITAFSIEDTNLWLRHLLNLVVQVTLALYVFWNSIGQINLQLVAPAIFIFVAGIIKYGERTWALKCGSQEGLRSSSGYKHKQLVRQNDADQQDVIYSRSKETYVLHTVLCARGLFAGRTFFQLDRLVREKLTDGFRQQEKQAKNSIIQLELGMMYDTLYTKAMVLQTWTGCIIRCVAHISMMIAFVLFLVTRKHGHGRVNVAITYTLFIGALIMEACAIAMVMLSPWTWAWAHLKNRRFLCWPPRSGIMSCIFKAIGGEERPWLSNSMGQYNLADSAIRDMSTPTLISKTINAFGLEKLCRNLWYTKYVEAKKIIDYTVEWIHRPPEEIFTPPSFLNKDLKAMLSLPFERVILCLHAYTDLHVLRHFGNACCFATADDEGMAKVKALVEECEKLSNYMMYLLAVHPSMLPVSSTAAHEVVTDYYYYSRTGSKLEALMLVQSEWVRDMLPFGPADTMQDLERSLAEIKEVWMRLLAYAAGKCRAELHARQLGDGGELLTFVWLLMVHHGLGGVASRELNLLQHPIYEKLLPHDIRELSFPQPKPLYAFESDQDSD